ncbi:MAG: prolyl oligopeptidase family serine peptidase [Armatimonadota bacterium]
MNRLTDVPIVISIMICAGCAMAQTPDATNLRGQYRAGQVFLQWDEPEGLEGARFRVLGSDKPITDANVAEAEVLGDYMLPGSSTDWWLNPLTYGKPLDRLPEDQREIVVDGWIIEEGGERLEPGNGLFVHTVTDETAGDRYYAVVSWPESAVVEIGSIVPGVNSLTEPIAGEVAPIEPIWQGDPADKPERGAGAQMPTDLALHAKTGRGGMEWLVFGPNELGWRESLAFKFGAHVADGGAVRVAPTDQHWIDRMFPEGNDSCQRLTPAVHTFWSGYNNNIYDPDLMDEGTVEMFGERRVLWIVDWVQDYFGTDPMRTYASGGSMGGCASFNIGFRNPDVFAAIAPHVGITTYAAGEGGDSERRIDDVMGSLDAPTEYDMTVREWLDSARFAREHEDKALPFVIMANGRNDGSIPWWMNPPFYEAMQESRQGLIAAWNEGEHGSTRTLLPDDIRERMSFDWMHRFALDRSYPAFTNCTANDDPGDGRAEDGDGEGYINRGLDWEVVKDEKDEYVVEVTWYLADTALPLRVDVTPRRAQNFVLEPGEKVDADVYCFVCKGSVGSRVLTADEHGLVTFAGVKLLGQVGSRLTLKRLGANVPLEGLGPGFGG